LNENSSSGNKVVPCGETDRTKLILAFRNFVTAPNNGPVLKSAAPILVLFVSQTLGSTLAKDVQLSVVGYLHRIPPTSVNLQNVIFNTEMRTRRQNKFINSYKIRAH